MPYLDTMRGREVPQQDRQLAFDFASVSNEETLTNEQMEELLRAIRGLVECRRLPVVRKKSRTLADAFYSMNILPSSNVQKYFDKIGLHPSEADSIAADWEKIGLDIWSGLLQIQEERSAAK